MKLVEVIWMDAMIEEGHIPPQAVEAMLPIERYTIEYVVDDNDDWVKLTYGTLENFYKGEQAYDMVLVIPRCMIKEVKQLRVNPL